MDRKSYLAHKKVYRRESGEGWAGKLTGRISVLFGIFADKEKGQRLKPWIVRASFRPG
jgi:hypothetical protein